MRNACINAVWVGALAWVAVSLCSCAEGPGFGKGATAKEKPMTVTQKAFGKTPAGETAQLFTLTNANGMQAEITNYGGIVVRLTAPDREGKFADVVLGYETLAEYIKASPYFGALVGRYGNRIAKGKFTLDGVEYTLATNNQENHLHGGKVGFDKALWAAEPVKTGEAVGLKLSYLSKDGEEGYPGNLQCTVHYWLTNDNELKIEYLAETDKPTVVNLTHHSYFNLAGQGCGDILSHELMINADRFTPVDAGLIPTGELQPVAGTPMDFRTPMAIGARVNQDDVQLQRGGGYDHNYVLNKDKPGAMTLAARVCEPTSGRVMEVHTTEPGLQFYCGNFLDGSNVGKGGKVYSHRYGFCLESHHFPDSPNKPDFPSVVLRPGEKYQTKTIYRFSAK
ncbi:MAG: galactose mutarotase [Phycisphaerae bacterium]|nr:galactose mutarotase [Phycisphaerae bacterium]